MQIYLDFIFLKKIGSFIYTDNNNTLIPLLTPVIFRETVPLNKITRFLVKQQISNKMCYFTLIRVHFRAKTWIRIKRIRIRYTDNNLLHFIFRSKRSRADWGEEEEGVRGENQTIRGRGRRFC